MTPTTGGPKYNHRGAVNLHRTNAYGELKSKSVSAKQLHLEIALFFREKKQDTAGANCLHLGVHLRDAHLKKLGDNKKAALARARSIYRLLNHTKGPIPSSRMQFFEKKNGVKREFKIFIHVVLNSWILKKRRKKLLTSTFNFNCLFCPISSSRSKQHLPFILKLYSHFYFLCWSQREFSLYIFWLLDLFCFDSEPFGCDGRTQQNADRCAKKKCLSCCSFTQPKKRNCVPYLACGERFTLI